MDTNSTNKLINPVHSWSEAMNEPITPVQKAYLERVDIPTDNIVTKKDAAIAIGNIPANIAQVNYLKNRGYDVSEGVTIGQFHATMQHDVNKSKK